MEAVANIHVSLRFNQSLMMRSFVPWYRGFVAVVVVQAVIIFRVLFCMV